MAGRSRDPGPIAPLAGVLLLLAWLPGVAQSAPMPCGTDLPLEQRLLIESVYGDEDAFSGRQGALLGWLRHLADQRPDDVWLQMTLQGAVDFEGLRDPQLRRELEAVHERRCLDDPMDPLAQTLHALWQDDVQRLAEVDEVVRLHPGDALARIARTRARLNVEQRDGAEAATADLLKALELCPDLAAPFLAYESMLEPGIVGARLPWLRDLVRSFPPPERVIAMPGLWSLEMRLAPPEEHSALRERIREDVVQLEAMCLERAPRWWRTLAQGYELAGAPATRDTLAERAAAADPCSSFVRSESGKRMGPVEQMSTAERRRYFELLRRRARECPDDATSATAILSQAAKDPDLRREDVPGIVERGLQAWTRVRPFVAGSGSSGEAAKLLVEHDLELERAIELAGEEMTWRRQWLAAEPPLPPDMPEELRRIAMLREDWNVLQNVSTQAEARVRLGQLDDATRDLEALDRSVAAVAAAELGGTGLPMAAAGVLRIHGELELARGNAADALASFLEAERTHPDGRKGDGTARAWRALGGSRRGLDALREGSTESVPLLAELAVDASASEFRAGSPDGAAVAPAIDRLPALLASTSGTPAGAAATRAWRALGGSDRALLQLERAVAMPASAVPSNWRPADVELPDFELVDVDGRTWRRADLDGKVALVHVWTTWCTPCRHELPFVAKVASAVAAQEDVVVITMSADESGGVVAPFLRRLGVRLPALLAVDYARANQDLTYAVPVNLVVGRDRRIRWKSTGFDAKRAEAWVGETVELIRMERERR